MPSIHLPLPIDLRRNYRERAAENTSPDSNWPFSISDIDLPGAHRRPQRTTFQRVVIRVAAVVAFVLALAVAWELPRPGVWLHPVVLPDDLVAADLTSSRATALLLEKIGIALRTHNRPEAPPAVRMEPARLSFVAAARWLRASAGLPDARLTVAISRYPEHWEIELRDARDGGAVAMRFGRDADLINRLTSSGAQAAVLLLAPALVADRLLADPAAMQNPQHLARVKAALARHGDVVANDPRFHLVRGKDYAARGDHDGAIEAYNTAVSIAPAEPRAFLFAAQSHAALGQRESALENLRHGKARSSQSPHDLTLAGALHVALAEPRPALALLAQADG
ncbi:MAG: tetratricopeptide repeat protein, partial [Casimicrobiaceae bacterium]